MNSLHLPPDITALPRIAHFLYYPHPSPGLGAVVTNGLPCIFSLLTTPYPGFVVVVTNGFSCTFYLLSLHYGIGGSGYKWIALYLLLTTLPRDWGPWLQMDCLASFPCYPGPTPELYLLHAIPAHFHDWGRGYKWIALHILPDFTFLPGGWGPWLQMDCLAPFPCYPRPTPGWGAVVTNGLPCIFSFLSPPYSLFPCYPGPIPGLRVVTNGLSCTFFLLSPPYAGVGGHDYKWIALHHLLDITALTRFSAGHLSPIIPTPTTSYPMFGAVVLNGMPCNLSLLFSPYHGFVGRDYKWITLQLLPAIPALHRSGVVVINGLSCTFSQLSPPYPGVTGRGCKWNALHLFTAFPVLLRSLKPWLQMYRQAPIPC